MLSKELYELLLEKYIDTNYNIYRFLMDLLKEEYELSDLTDDEFVNEMIVRYGKYGKSKSIFDEDVDFDTFTNIYANYIEYDEENLKDIDTFMKEDLKDIDYSMREDFLLNNCSLDYFKSPEFVNKLLKLWINFEDVLEYVSDEVRNDKDYFAKIKVKDKEFPSLIGKKLLNDEDFILENLDKIEYKYISDELKHNKNFILKLMTKDASLFPFLDEKFRDDKEIVLTALGKYGITNRSLMNFAISLFKHVSDRLKDDYEIIDAAIDYCTLEYEYLPIKYKNDKKVIEKVLSKDKDIAQYLEDEIRNDTSYMEELFLKYDLSIMYTNEEIIKKYADNKDVMRKEILKNPDSFKYLSADLSNNLDFISSIIHDDKFKGFNSSLKEANALLKFYRDEERIDVFCNALADLWKKNRPDWRFGQLMVNILNSCPNDPFFYEEDEMLEEIKKFFESSDD